MSELTFKEKKIFFFLAGEGSLGYKRRRRTNGNRSALINIQIESTPASVLVGGVGTWSVG